VLGAYIIVIATLHPSFCPPCHPIPFPFSPFFFYSDNRIRRAGEWVRHRSGSTSRRGGGHLQLKIQAFPNNVACSPRPTRGWSKPAEFEQTLSPRRWTADRTIKFLVIAPHGRQRRPCGWMRPSTAAIDYAQAGAEIILVERPRAPTSIRTGSP